MRYLALASDYDGTIAHDGVVNDVVVRAIERLIHSGVTAEPLASASAM